MRLIFHKDPKVLGLYISTEKAPSSSIETKYGAFYLNNEVKVHGLVLLFQLGVARPDQQFRTMMAGSVIFYQNKFNFFLVLTEYIY